MSMREVFSDTLADIADRDSHVVLLVADLGYHVLDSFRTRHPDKFINVGVSEQLMIGMATGLAKEGLHPYCYSISTFALLRPLEFIRNGPLHHHLPVKIVGVGRGEEYENMGETHWLHKVEAEKICQAIGLPYLYPSSDGMARLLLKGEHALFGPSFMHLSKQ